MVDLFLVEGSYPGKNLKGFHLFGVVNNIVNSIVKNSESLESDLKTANHSRRDYFEI